MTRTLDDQWPTWLRDVDALLAVHPHFVLSGNIRDRYLLPGDRVVDSLPIALLSVLGPSGFDTILLHDLVDGYRLLGSDDDLDAGWAHVHAVTGTDLRSIDGADLGALARVIRSLAEGGDRRIALVLDYASRLSVDPGSLTTRENEFFTACLKLSHAAQPAFIETASRRDLYNPVFWLVDREHDQPSTTRCSGWSTESTTCPHGSPLATERSVRFRSNGLI